MGHANFHPLSSTLSHFQHGDEDAHLCAYNVALDELGLRFRWDAATLRSVVTDSDEKQAIANYLTTHQAYLLKAYDVEFLSQLILDKKNQRFQTGSELAVSRYV